MTSIPSFVRMPAFEFCSTVKSSSNEVNAWRKSAPFLATGPWVELKSRRRLCSKTLLKCYLELPFKPFVLKTSKYATRFTVISFCWIQNREFSHVLDNAIAPPPPPPTCKHRGRVIILRECISVAEHHQNRNLPWDWIVSQFSHFPSSNPFTLWCNLIL